MASLYSLLNRPLPLFLLAAALRAVLLLYGLWQDANSPVKYTDIDYLVFTDAARLVARGGGGSGSSSPYDRETYRYTPLLAWMLVPTAWEGRGWFEFGKVVFAASDLLAGWLLVRILMLGRGGSGSASGGGRREGRGGTGASEPGKGKKAEGGGGDLDDAGSGGGGMSSERAHLFATIWLLNPMVATISTRGSSEGLLGVLAAALLYAVLRRQVAWAGFILGLGVHFKIYPFIWAPAILWWMDAEKMGHFPPSGTSRTIASRIVGFVTRERVTFAIVSFSTFMGLNMLMFSIYGAPFLTHTYLHHVTRVDHRHNFSPYNIFLYLSSARPTNIGADDPSSSFPPLLPLESLAFLPQLLLSAVLIPLSTAKKDLAATMQAQTFAFVAFNKVCTSQYFLWYLVFLPVCLPRSSLWREPGRGLVALLLWVATQAAWLQQAYGLEFLGRSTFFPGLEAASLAFFAVNCWILGVMVLDAGSDPAVA